MCPICGCEERTMLFDGLMDRMFFVAPGEWTMWMCGACKAAYLDPRPSEDSIASAYEKYYTHGQDADSFSGQRAGFSASLKQRIRNGYLNNHFGYNLTPALALGAMGAWALGCFSAKKAQSAEAAVRHLPRVEGAGKALLDVGCGNGSFLKIAESIGYQAVGLEPDPKSATYARMQGFGCAGGGL